MGTSTVSAPTMLWRLHGIAFRAGVRWHERAMAAIRCGDMDAAHRAGERAEHAGRRMRMYGAKLHEAERRLDGER